MSENKLEKQNAGVFSLNCLKILPGLAEQDYFF